MNEGDFIAVDGLLREASRGGPGADERFVARVMSAVRGPEARQGSWLRRVIAMAASLMMCAAVIWTIVSSTQESDVARFVTQLSDESAEVRDRAETELMKLGSRAVPPLEEAMQKGDADLKGRGERIVRAAPFVEMLGYPAGRDLALATDPWQKIDALAKSKAHLDSTTGPKVAEAILSAFPWAENYDDSKHQRDLFKLQEDYVQKNRTPSLAWLFARMLAHKHAYVRGHAIGDLHLLGAKEHAEAVRPSLKDPARYMKQHAANALLAFDSAKYGPEVAALLEDADADVRQGILVLLTARPGAVTVELIAARLVDKNAGVRAYASNALEELGAISTLQAMRNAVAIEKDATTKLMIEAAIRSLESLRGERKAVAVTKEWHGDDSKIVARDLLRITDAAAWTELWSRHAPDTKPPEIDFASSMVVAIFQGRGWNSSGVIPVNASEDDATVRLRYDEQSYQTAGPGGGGVRVTAYGFIVLPKSAKLLVIEENVQSLLHAAALWKERARFP